MNDTVLIVDDDLRLLDGLRRKLHGRMNVLTAAGGEEALACIGQGTPIAVILCDMRMPGMDGIAVLQAFRERSPDTVRMMLTGNADQATAVDAINKGEIFRFLNKPCETDLLFGSLEAGMRQYHLVTAERELLENTLAGSVKLLLDVLNLSGVGVAHSVQDIRDWGKAVARGLGLAEAWKLDMALMLSGVGRVAIPPELSAKVREKKGLSQPERQLIEQVPRFGRDLIANIPRLRTVAEIVCLQDRGFDGSGFPADGPRGADIPVESRILKILQTVGTYVDGGVSLAGAFQALKEKPGPYDQDLLAKIRDIVCPASDEAAESGGETVVMPIAMLKPGDILLSDIKTMEDRLILAAGQRLSGAQVALLKNWMALAPLRDPVEVRRWDGPPPAGSGKASAAVHNG